jgi:hypothetical protein
MANGWQTLGGVLGGGADIEGAFMRGQHTGAQTANAMEQARNRRLEGQVTQQKIAARQRIQEMAAEYGLDPGDVDLMLGGLGSDFASVQQGRLRGQEFGLRARAADPEVPFAEGQRALMGVASGPVDPLRSQEGLVYSLFSPEEREISPQSAALAEQRSAAASLSRAREEWGPSQSGVTVNLGEMLTGMQPQGSVLRGTPTGYAGATGVPGAFTTTLNTVANILRMGMPFPEEHEARQEMMQMAERTRSAGRTLLNYPEGRITNQMLNNAGVYVVDPTDILRGDDLALSRARSTLRSLNRDLQDKVALLNTGALTRSTQDRTLQSIQTLQNAVADHEALIELFGAGLEQRGAGTGFGGQQIRQRGGAMPPRNAPGAVEGVPAGWGAEIE